MKVKFISVAVAAALSFSANAALENSFTFGVGGGWNHQFGSLSKEDYRDPFQTLQTRISNKNGFGVKLNAEYNFTSWFGLGVGYNYLAGTKAEVSYNNIFGFEDSEKYKIKSHVAELYGRFAYPLDNVGSDIFLKVGPTANFTKIDGERSDKIGFVAGIGGQWAINQNVALRAGYDYFYNTGRYEEGRLKNGLLYATVQFTFGGPSSAPVKQKVKVTEKFNLDQKILFPFDSSVLSDNGVDAVNQIVASSADLQDVEYAVYGYTDRIGSDEYNLKLSQRRADSVTGQFKTAGVTSVTTSEGRGKASPVTGDKCDSVKGRKALVDCLAPDRRVEVFVTGQTEIEE